MLKSLQGKYFCWVLVFHFPTAFFKHAVSYTELIDEICLTPLASFDHHWIPLIAPTGRQTNRLSLAGPNEHQGTFSSLHHHKVYSDYTRL